MKSKYYQMALDALANILGTGPMGPRLDAISKLGDPRTTTGRFVFEDDGKQYVFYLVYNGNIPEIATPNGDALPFPVLIRILKTTHGPEWFGNRVMNEYEQTHSRALNALNDVFAIHKELRQMKVAHAPDPILGFFENLMAVAVVNNKLTEAITTIEQLAGAAKTVIVKPTMETPNE